METGHKYLVVNCSTLNLHLVVPAPMPGLSDACITVSPSSVVDLLPVAGSRDACLMISCLNDWVSRGYVKIIES